MGSLDGDGPAQRQRELFELADYFCFHAPGFIVLLALVFLPGLAPDYDYVVRLLLADADTVGIQATIVPIFFAALPQSRCASPCKQKGSRTRVVLLYQRHASTLSF